MVMAILEVDVFAVMVHGANGAANTAIGFFLSRCDKYSVYYLALSVTRSAQTLTNSESCKTIGVCQVRLFEEQKAALTGNATRAKST